MSDFTKARFFGALALAQKVVLASLATFVVLTLVAAVVYGCVEIWREIL